MVEVARDVAARLAVDGPALVDLEQVAVAAGLRFQRLVQVETGAFVFGEPRPLLDRAGGEEAQAGQGAAEAERSWCHGRVSNPNKVGPMPDAGRDVNGSVPLGDE
jgi:hypothetical protein